MRRAAIAVVAVLLSAATALADGVIVPGRAVVKPVRTPDQRALVAFDGTTETLVIETTLQGEGRDFAWIVPLPAAPRIEESTTGLFPRLEVMCGPDLVDHDDRLWLVIPWVGLGFLVAAWRSRTRRPRLGIALEFAVVLLLSAGLVAAVAITVPTMRDRGTSSSGAVSVLSRESVGSFDTATLAATDAASLRTWLDANGFRAPEAIDAVADDYAKRGWVFVASKVRRDADDAAVRRVHPLAFTFPAKEAVYPMRLTGAANDSLALELFVFGVSRAEAAGLDVETCDPRVADALDSWSPHTELHRRVKGAACLTKLVGTLDREAMREDVALRWVDGKRERDTYVSAAVARSIAADCALVGLFVVLVWAEARRLAWTWRRRLVVALVAAAAVGGAGWWISPRLPAGSWEIPHRRGRDAIDWSREPHEVFTDAAAARAWVISRTAGRTNPYTGDPVREEDSPGNWVVRDVDGLIELALFEGDRYGPQEWTINLSSSKAGDRRNVRSARTFQLEGVVRGADGNAIAGAQVRVDSADPRSAGRDRDWFQGACETTTDANGRFRIEGLADEKWDVAVDENRHAMLLVEDVDPRRVHAPIELLLPDGVALTGRVVDTQGRPVERARVLAQPTTPFMCPQVRCVATSADGTFEFPGFAAGSKDVEVTVSKHVGDGPDRFAKFAATPGGAPVEFRLDLR